MVISSHCRVACIKHALLVAVMVGTVVGLVVVQTSEVSGHENSIITRLIFVYPEERADRDRKYPYE